MEHFYTKACAAYESLQTLQQATKLSRNKKMFLQNKYPQEKRLVRRNFPRHEEVAYNINGMRSIDVAYIDKLAKKQRCEILACSSG